MIIRTRKVLKSCVPPPPQGGLGHAPQEKGALCCCACRVKSGLSIMEN